MGILAPHMMTPCTGDCKAGGCSIGVEPDPSSRRRYAFHRDPLVSAAICSRRRGTHNRKALDRPMSGGYCDSALETRAAWGKTGMILAVFA